MGEINRDGFKNENDANNNSVFENKTNFNQLNKNNKTNFLNNTINQTPIAENIVFENDNNNNTLSKNILEKTVQHIFDEKPARQKNIDKINYLDLNALTTDKNTFSVKTKTNKVFKTFIRFSFEGGTSAFSQPMGRLFSDSSSFDPVK